MQEPNTPLACPSPRPLPLKFSTPNDFLCRRTHRSVHFRETEILPREAAEQWRGSRAADGAPARSWWGWGWASSSPSSSRPPASPPPSSPGEVRFLIAAPPASCSCPELPFGGLPLVIDGGKIGSCGDFWLFWSKSLRSLFLSILLVGSVRGLVTTSAGVLGLV